jgi:hypothetical protein
MALKTPLALAASQRCEFFIALFDGASGDVIPAALRPEA